jgi:hypothetical protein
MAASRLIRELWNSQWDKVKTGEMTKLQFALGLSRFDGNKLINMSDDELEQIKCARAGIRNYQADCWKAYDAFEAASRNPSPALEVLAIAKNKAERTYHDATNGKIPFEDLLIKGHYRPVMNVSA